MAVDLAFSPPASDWCGQVRQEDWGNAMAYRALKQESVSGIRRVSETGFLWRHRHITFCGMLGTLLALLLGRVIPHSSSSLRNYFPRHEGWSVFAAKPLAGT